MGNINRNLKPKTINELTKSTGFNEEEIQDWYRGFQKDYPNGFLSIDEFKNLYGTFFQDGGEEASDFSRHVFRTFDTNGDGKIDFKYIMLCVQKEIKRF